jgi:hypothetical protein
MVDGSGVGEAVLSRVAVKVVSPESLVRKKLPAAVGVSMFVPKS